ncbi:MAG TPA: Gmad2 immunoglobulin-like domain-containing protein [Nocardioidaceae bacterium]
MTQPRARRTPAGAHRLRRALVVALAVAVAGSAAGCGSDDDGGTPPSASPTTSGATSPSPAESATPAEPAVSGVYYMADTRNGLRLTREMRDLAGDDPAKEAVETMISGPVDPDYVTPWNEETEVLGVTREAETIAVDLSEDARTANIGSEGAALMIQQLVYTVTEAVDEEASVELLIEGEPAGELWGVVTWDGPVTRDDPLDVRALVQIDYPREGDSVSSPLTVEGEAAAFEANVPWRILDDSGVEVETGFTMTSEGQTFAPFSFEVDLAPGTYLVEISEDDPSGGEGGTPTTDTKTVTVE